MLMVVTKIEGEKPRSVYFCFVKWCGDIRGRKQDVSFSNITQAHLIMNNPTDNKVIPTTS